LLLSELPTYRDTLRYAVLLREQCDKNSRTFLIKDMAKKVACAVITQWQKANANFKAPIIYSEKNIVYKIIKAWDVAFLISANRENKENKKDFILKLDKLFDILNCKCIISDCKEFGCKVICKQQAHITCNCCKEYKIPIIDVFYIKTERDKVGAKGLLQISSKDMPEHNRQVKKLYNHSNKEAFKRKRANSITTNTILNNDFSMTEDELTNEEFNTEPSTSNSKVKKSKYNTKSVRNVAIHSLR